ncbi:NAD(P)-binding domain-containing protein [Oerskovia sp. M15]
MTSITIIGAGNIAAGVARIALDGGAQVQVLARNAEKAAALGSGASFTSGVVGDEITGDLVVLALPFPAVPEVLAQYAGRLDGKVLVDPTNPVDFATFDSLVVPADSSAAAEIAALARARASSRRSTRTSRRRSRAARSPTRPRPSWSRVTTTTPRAPSSSSCAPAASRGRRRIAQAGP